MKAELASYLEQMKGFPSFEEFAEIGVHTRNHFGETALHYVSIQGNAEVVGLLLAEGADPNLRGEHGYTPLAEAISQGHLDVAKVLLAAAADPDLKSDDGSDALEIASLNGIPGFVEQIEKFIAESKRRSQ
jgi:ankyrin repeat protein